MIRTAVAEKTVSPSKIPTLKSLRMEVGDILQAARRLIDNSDVPVRTDASMCVFDAASPFVFTSHRAAEVKSREFPFGRDDINLLIVCMSEEHRKLITDAFRLKAHYVVGIPLIAGRGYTRIIIFIPDFHRNEEHMRRFQEWCREFLPTKLKIPNEGIFYI